MAAAAGSSSTTGSYWVTWQDTSDTATAKASALLWGPQANAPAQVQGMLQAGPFPTKAAAQAYENAIGTNAILPPPGTPIVGDIPAPSNPLAFLGFLGDIGHWLGIAVAALTDKYTWISVGWLLLGLVLVVISLYMLGKGSGVLPSAVPVPVPV